MDSFIYSLNATVPVFLVMIIGNILNRKGIINRQFSNVADKLVYKVCLPCMLYLNLAGTDIRNHFDVTYVGYCVFATLTSILVLWGMAKILMQDRSMIGAFVQGSYRSSAAILGIAFISNIYGTSEMAPQMIIGSVPLYNIFAVLVLTMEAPDLQDIEGEQPHKTIVYRQIKKAAIGVAKNPIIISILVGMLASYFQFSLPGMFEKTISNLGILTAPLALLSIGASFEGRKAIAKIKPTLVASFFKLVGLTMIFLPIAVWLGFRDQKLIALIIMLASPCTPTAYIMAKNLKGDDVLASSIVVVTTLFSSITLTGWIFLARFLELVK